MEQKLQIENMTSKTTTKEVIIKEVIIREDIPSRLHYENQDLQSIVISKDVKTIGNYAFSRCKALKTVRLEDGVKRIGEGCFEDCESLEVVILPESVKSIHPNAFRGCSSLKSVVLPNDFRMITESMFAGCKKLTSIIIPETVCMVQTKAFENCVSLQEVIFNGTAAKTFEDSFVGCDSLSEESIASIAQHLVEPIKTKFRSDKKGIAGRLSNQTARNFTFDGVACASIESVLQSFKFKEIEEQRNVCALSGREAKDLGLTKEWSRQQILYWNGQEYPRKSREYQLLLDRLFQTVYEQDPAFRYEVGMLAKSNVYFKHTGPMEDTVLTAIENYQRLISWSHMPLGEGTKQLHFAETMMELIEKEEKESLEQENSEKENLEKMTAEEAGNTVEKPVESTEKEFTEKVCQADYENVKRVVVLGGSFNPPTIAHRELLLHAVKAVGADRGIFVPAPFEYVKRKMKKSGNSQQTLTNETRIQMLESMCNTVQETELQLVVDDCEAAEKIKGFTYETLLYISKEYPNAEIYFLAGSDKLHIIPRWHRVSEFLNQFRILVAKRNGETPEQLLEENPFLCEHKETFVIFSIPEAFDEISSSMARELYYTGQEKVKEMITKDVYEIWRKEKPVLGPCINRFRDSYDFLSNFHPAIIEYRGLMYLNAESTFQAQKCLTEEEKKAFCELPSSKAKRMGRNVALRSDWEEVKVGFMEEIVRCKFEQNEELAMKLLETGDIPLVEGNTWGDVFWGVDLRNGKGENHLGKILMKVREELRAKYGV